MYPGKLSLRVVTLLLILGILATGTIAAAYIHSPQTKGPESSNSPNPSSHTSPEILQSKPPESTSAASNMSPTVGSAQPHYFLQTGRASAGIQPSVSSNDVVYHGGPTMHISISYPIFWLPNGTNFEGSVGTNSAYISLIDRFLNDTSGTSYYNILNQYPDNIDGAPLDKSVLGGSYLDTTPYPSAGTQSDPLHNSDIQAEIVRAMAANNWTPGPDKIFHVFTGYGIESCFEATNNSCTYNAYCAYHDFFMQGTQAVIYSNMPDFNAGYTRCITGYQTFPNGDHYADPEINVLSHELFEAVSDPQINAWYGFGEIGDLCAWRFGPISLDGSNLVINGHKYLVQLEWSNYGSNCVLSYGPSNYVSIAPSPGSDPFPSTISFNITYASQGSNWWSTTAYANGSLTINVDQNTQVAITNETSTLGQSEKWCFDQKCAGVSFSSGDAIATTYYYYDLLAQRVSVSPSLGVPSASMSFATGSMLPSTLGLPRLLTIQLNQTTQTIWALRGATASVASPTNAGINTRWVTRMSTWIISYASQIPNPILYYPQYLTTFQYTVTGGGVYSSPTVTYYDSGLPRTALTGTPVWADSAGSYSYQSQLPSSTQYERWSATNAIGQVSVPGSNVSTNYYHEFNVTISFQFTKGSPFTSPYLTGETYGLNIPITLSLQGATIWLDAGSTYSLTNTLYGASQLERWQAAGQTTGIVGGAMILSPKYIHQYFLTVTGALPGVTGQGWYDSGSTALATSPGIYGASSTTRSRLVSYSVDNGVPTILNTIDQVPVQITMNLSHNIRFSSTTQYSLTSVLPTNSMSSITPSPTGDSWYDEGTSVFIVLNRNWDVIGSTRQSLVAYSIDIFSMSVDRSSGGPVGLPAVVMATSHVLSEQSVTQYFILVQGATVSGSQTGDGWYDSGSQFTVEGAYSHAYAADFPYHVYAIPAGFQILANATVDSLLWTSSSDTLSLGSSQVQISVYVPAELNLVPTRVLDDGTPIQFTYSDTSHVLSFTGSSRFQVNLSSTVTSSPSQPLISDWVLYPLMIAIIVGVILVLGLVLIRRKSRKPET
jgi:hypothetical protein